MHESRSCEDTRSTRKICALINIFNLGGFAFIFQSASCLKMFTLLAKFIVNCRYSAYSNTEKKKNRTCNKGSIINKVN